MVVPGGLSDRAILIDTAAFLAALHSDDQWHTQAVGAFRRLAQEARPILTTNLIVSETYGLLLHRTGARQARIWLGRLTPMLVVYQEPRHAAEVSRLLASRPDQTYSYTDAFSFVAMRERGLRTAFTFDHHFSTAGFDVIP